jgi:hypothetical protein
MIQSLEEFQAACGPATARRLRLLDAPPEFIIGPAFGRARWRA